MTKQQEQEKEKPKVLNVYQAIAKVQGELAKQGISKDRSNQQQGYKFRGIDDIYNALSPLLAESGLCILPRVMKREVTERHTQKGGVLFYVVIDMEYDFVSAGDGSKHTIAVCGEAMDSGDKATNKAMSAAYKYACLQTFSIPTEGDNDADATTHDVSKVKSVFPNAAKRKEFMANLTAAYESAPTMDDLKMARSQYAAKLVEMRGGGEEYDGMAVDEANRIYERAKYRFDHPYTGEEGDEFKDGGRTGISY